MATSMGVESTARAAHEHGYHVVVVTDAVTDTDPDAHTNSIERTFPKLGERTTTDELLELLPRAHDESTGLARPQARPSNS